MKNIKLNPAELTFDENGVADFAWPIERDEIRAVRNVTLRELAQLLRERPDDTVGRITRVAIPYHTMHTLGLYRGRCLYQRLPDREVRVPADSDWIGPAAAGSVPEETPLVAKAKGGIYSSRQHVPSILRRAKWSIKWNGLDPSGLRRPRPAHDVLAVSTSPLTQRHARSTTRSVAYRPLDHWFDTVTSDEMENFRSLGTDAADLVVEAVESGFEAGNLPLDEASREAMRKVTADLTSVLAAHIDRLDSSPLPSHLWGGAGVLWTRLLAESVSHEGGSVVLHDHGRGGGHLGPLARTIIDFELADYFVTFNERIAREYREQGSFDLLTRSDRPTITSLAPDGRRESIVDGATAGRSDGRDVGGHGTVDTIMYVSALYPGDRVRLAILPPGVVAADWQYRLLGRLDDWGYDVVHQPHPESLYDVPPVFESEFGVRTSDRQFEFAMDEADLFLMDNPFSTTFPMAVTSDTPVVLVDFNRISVGSETRSLMEERCPIVDGWFDSENRARVDWDSLREAIQAAPERTGRQYVEEYLSYH